MIEIIENYMEFTKSLYRGQDKEINNLRSVYREMTADVRHLLSAEWLPKLRNEHSLEYYRLILKNLTPVSMALSAPEQLLLPATGESKAEKPTINPPKNGTLGSAPYDFSAGFSPPNKSLAEIQSGISRGRMKRKMLLPYQKKAFAYRQGVLKENGFADDWEAYLSLNDIAAPYLRKRIGQFLDDTARPYFSLFDKLCQKLPEGRGAPSPSSGELIPLASARWLYQGSWLAPILAEVPLESTVDRIMNFFGRTEWFAPDPAPQVRMFRNKATAIIPGFVSKFITFLSADKEGRENLEIYLSPIDSFETLGILLHELGHAAQLQTVIRHNKEIIGRKGMNSGTVPPEIFARFLPWESVSNEVFAGLFRLLLEDRKFVQSACSVLDSEYRELMEHYRFISLTQSRYLASYGLYYLNIYTDPDRYGNIISRPFRRRHTRTLQGILEDLIGKHLGVRKKQPDVLSRNFFGDMDALRAKILLHKIGKDVDRPKEFLVSLRPKIKPIVEKGMCFHLEDFMAVLSE